MALATAAVLWLAPEQAAAQQAPAPPAPPARAAAAAATATAQVEDQYGEVMRVEEPAFYKPSSGLSLGGGGKGAKLKEIRVWRGAHEILVPLERISRIEVLGASDQDLLLVRLTLAGGLKLEGKIERDLELRGRVDYGQYQIKFERLKSVTIRA